MCIFRRCVLVHWRVAHARGHERMWRGKHLAKMNARRGRRWWGMLVWGLRLGLRWWEWTGRG